MPKAAIAFCIDSLRGKTGYCAQPLLLCQLGSALAPARVLFCQAIRWGCCQALQHFPPGFHPCDRALSWVIWFCHLLLSSPRIPLPCTGLLFRLSMSALACCLGFQCLNNYCQTLRLCQKYELLLLDLNACYWLMTHKQEFVPAMDSVVWRWCCSYMTQTRRLFLFLLDFWSKNETVILSCGNTSHHGLKTSFHLCNCSEQVMGSNLRATKSFQFFLNLTHL